MVDWGQAADTLFDGGLRAAQTDAARATYSGGRQLSPDRAHRVPGGRGPARRVALFRQGVEDPGKARDRAAEAVKVYLNQYSAGTVAFTTVVVAEATLLADEEAALSTRQALFNATVYLIEYLGGGFDASELLAEQPPPLTEAIARSLPVPPP